MPRKDAQSQQPDQVQKPVQTNPDATNPPQTQNPRSGCCPYDFDGNHCKIVDDRMLCGYNKNFGQPESKNSEVQIQGGCRIRGGRIECGYQRGPFTNSRRPPVGSVQHPIDNRIADSQSPNHLQSGEHHGPKPTRNPVDMVTKCVELENRIVCRKV